MQDLENAIPTASEETARQHTLFLMDGLRKTPSPVLLIIADAATAETVAQVVHAGSTHWEDMPTRVASLLKLDVARVAENPAWDANGFLAELAATDHWVYLSDVDALVESPAGREFLDRLMTSVGDGGLAAVIASTRGKRLPTLHSKAPRLMGFAGTLDPHGDFRLAGLTRTTAMAVPSTVPDDAGWLIAVRYELSTTIKVAANPGTSADGRLNLVDTIKVVELGDHEPPLGVLIGLTPDAFTVSQVDAAFATATLAAERIIGRRLDPGERVTASRGIFYA